MKKLFLIALLTTLSLCSSAYSFSNGCWYLGQYSVTASQGDPHGRIEVLVYTNSSMSTLLQTSSFGLNANGAVSFTVNQPVLTSPVFVYVRWLVRNADGTYSPTTWNSGQGYPNSYSSEYTGTSACFAVPITFKSVQAIRVTDDTYKVIFEVEEASGVNTYRVRLSKDGIHFVDRAIIFPDNTTRGTYSAVIKL